MKKIKNILLVGVLIIIIIIVVLLYMFNKKTNYRSYTCINAVNDAYTIKTKQTIKYDANTIKDVSENVSYIFEDQDKYSAYKVYYVKCKANDKTKTIICDHKIDKEKIKKNKLSKYIKELEKKGYICKTDKEKKKDN